MLKERLSSILSPLTRSLRVCQIRLIPKFTVFLQPRDVCDGIVLNGLLSDFGIFKAGVDFYALQVKKGLSACPRTDREEQLS